MKRALSILITLLLLCGLALPATAEDTAVATTLRLEKTEGTVTVSNAAGKTVKITDGMRLYSGYTISTEAGSYAYVSLDSTKAVKLDASSKAEVLKSGKKLELMLAAGKLFFNVSTPLKEDESLDIRTATMVTGVRGTSAYLEICSRFTSKLYALEGTLEVTSSEPATGQIRQVTITGGQFVTSALNASDAPGQQTSLTVSSVDEKEIPAFVAVEVAADSMLQKKISELSPLSVPEIIGDASNRLKAEQDQAAAEQQTIQNQLENITSDQIEQVFTNQPEAGSGESSGESSDDTGGDADDDTDDDGGGDAGNDDVTDITLSLDNPSAADLVSALERTDVACVNVTNAGTQLSSASYAVRNGQTLAIQSGTFTVGTAQTLTVEGTFQNSANTVIEGTATIGGTADNTGAITIASDNSLHVTGTMTNSGSIEVGTDLQRGLLDISGSLENSGSIIIRSKMGYMTNSGTLTNSGSLGTENDANVLDGNLFSCTGSYEEERQQLYAMATANDQSGMVSYLGPANQLTWYSNTIVTLTGASSGVLDSADTGTDSPDSGSSWFDSSGSSSISSNGSMPFDAQGVTLDLNGRTAMLNRTWSIEPGGRLTIQDTSAEQRGSLTASGSNTSGALLSLNAGFLTIDSGTIVHSGGDAIQIIDKSVLTVNGGTISSESGNGITAQLGEVAISDGAVEGSVCGILIKDATVAISGGSVTLTTPPDEFGSLEGYAVCGPFAFSGTAQLKAYAEDNLFLPDFIRTDVEYGPPIKGTDGYFVFSLSNVVQG